jgi:N-acetyl-anhydromuramyl-L-alanine amidase AmpD
LKIRFLTRVSSSVHGSHKPGDVFDWKDDAEAKQLIAAGMAEAVKSTKTEKATASKKVETATKE